MSKDRQKPGEKPKKPGEYKEKGPRGGEVDKPRQVTIETGIHHSRPHKNRIGLGRE